MRLNEPSQIKQKCLSISSLEDYLQINAFLASSDRVEMNFLQLKATESQ